MKNPKALFIVVNAGFSQEIVDIARGLGARDQHPQRPGGHRNKTIMGITVDLEKEMVLPRWKPTPPCGSWRP